MPTFNLQRFFLVQFLILSTIGHVLAQQTPDVRQVRWGFSPKQVKEAESSKLTSKKTEKLVYARVPLINRTVGLEYTFNGDSLLSASYYYYMTAAITQADVMAARTELDSLLQEKYGPGKTAKVGEILNKVWLTPRTQISLSLGNVDRGWSLELVYLCRVYPGQPANAGWKPRKDIPDL
ncbi:hypothetical protein [Spirosoma validum]|uniref:DUF4390 domain-containing protein n=1 Tax=Spirosoma validum TaxID=2771355 RepID=A0A927B7L1_9BACT|nr:hypothetical protein [Spirosoma validum]MBD2756763.1 hypothetical protein [Spirosoma validum]